MVGGSVPFGAAALALPAASRVESRRSIPGSLETNHLRALYHDGCVHSADRCADCMVIRTGGDSEIRPVLYQLPL